MRHLIKATIAAIIATMALAVPAQVQAQTEEATHNTSNLIPADQVKADLDALYAAMQDASVDLYAYRSKPDFDAFHKGLRSGVSGPMSRLDAALLFQRFAAFARIGHIRSYAWLNEVFAELGQGAKFAPIFIRVERDGRVVLTENANADGTASAGAQLRAINGEPIARIVARTRDLISAERPYMADTVLEDFFPALFWAQHRDAKEFELELVKENALVTAKVPAITFSEYREMDTSVASLGTDFNTRAFRMISDQLAYLRPGPFSAIEGEEPLNGDPEAAMVKFLDRSFEAAVGSGANDLIIDLRNNPGGDISFSDPMVAWFADKPFRFASSFTLRASAQVKAHYDRVAGPGSDISPSLARLADEERAQPNGALYPYEIETASPRLEERFEGRVWVLINRKSYSNATSTAALIKDYGFGTIMGEETADVPNSFASIFPYVLPESGMTVDLTKSYFVRPSRDQTVRGVKPDVTLPRQEIGTDADTMLLAAIAHIEAAN